MKRIPINRIVTGQDVLDLIEDGYKVHIKTDFIYKIYGLIFQDYEDFKNEAPFKRNYYIDFYYDQLSNKFYRDNTYNSKEENKVLLEIPTEDLDCFVIGNNLYLK